MKSMMYLLPEDLRRELKKPLGILLRDPLVPFFLSKISGPLVTIGDVCSMKALEAGKRPKVMIVDFKTLRRTVHGHLEILRKAPPEYKRVKVKNPAGTITSALMDCLKMAMARKGNTLIVVEGEEDLAALPAILASPEGSWIMYGQPGEGAVFIRVKGMVKRSCEEVIRRMEVKPDGDNDRVQEVQSLVKEDRSEI